MQHLIVRYSPRAVSMDSYIMSSQVLRLFSGSTADCKVACINIRSIYIAIPRVNNYRLSLLLTLLIYI